MHNSEAIFLYFQFFFWDTEGPGSGKHTEIMRESSLFLLF